MVTITSKGVRIIKILSNEHRFSMLKELASHDDEMCVNELAASAGISQSLASHQLAYLSAAGVVESRRVGQTICYTLKESALTHVVIETMRVIESA